jgi:hypothetical protein
MKSIQEHVQPVQFLNRLKSDRRSELERLFLPVADSKSYTTEDTEDTEWFRDFEGAWPL